MAFKAVIFDMDGTLLNTLTDVANSANRALAKNGFAQHSVEDYRYFVGKGALNLIRSILPGENRNEPTIEKCLNDFLADYESNWNVATNTYPGIPELLNHLIDRSFKMAILSNKPHAMTTTCALEFLSEWRFDLVWGLCKKIPRKPDPTGALKIARRLKIDPSHCVYLGDTDIDMKTAISAGMHPVGVSWGFRPKEELLEAGAKTLIEKPRQLLQLFR